MRQPGIDSSGEVVIYWWVPSFGGDWEVTTITEGVDPSLPRPTRTLSSHASAAGTLNLLGSDDEGAVVRASWNPGDGGVWALENLTSEGELV